MKLSLPYDSVYEPGCIERHKAFFSNNDEILKCEVQDESTLSSFVDRHTALLVGSLTITACEVSNLWKT